MTPAAGAKKTQQEQGGIDARTIQHWVQLAIIIFLAGSGWVSLEGKAEANAEKLREISHTLRDLDRKVDGLVERVARLEARN